MVLSKKYLWIVFSLSLQIGLANSQYVWAPSGLNVIDYPSKEGKVFGKLIYGEKVAIEYIDYGRYRSSTPP